MAISEQITGLNICVYIASQVVSVCLGCRCMKRKALAWPNWTPCMGNSFKVSSFTPQSCASAIIKHRYRKLSRQMYHPPSYAVCFLVLILLKASVRNSFYGVRCYKSSVPVSKLECGFAFWCLSTRWKEIIHQGWKFLVNARSCKTSHRVICDSATGWQPCLTSWWSIKRLCGAADAFLDY